MKRITACAVVLMVLALSLQGCSQMRSLLSSFVDKPEIRGIHPRITGLDFKGVNLAFDVDLFNPYSFPLKSPAFEYGLDIQGERFMKSDVTTDVDLPAKDVGTVTLPVHLEYLDLWKTFKNVKDEPEIAYNLNGAMVLKPMGKTVKLPMEKSGTFPVLKIPKISDIRINPSDISLTEAKVGVKALVTNPNNFPISLDGLGYKLKIGDLDFADCGLSSSGDIGAGDSQQINLKSCLPGPGFKSLDTILDAVKARNIDLVTTGSLGTPYGKAKMEEE